MQKCYVDLYFIVFFCMSLNITKKDLFWLAGLIEGDGCFTSQKNRPVVSLALTDKDVLEKAANLLNTSFYTATGEKQGYKDQYIFQIKSEKAISIMNALYPYMGERRKIRIDDVKKNWNLKCNEMFSANKKASDIDIHLLKEEYKTSSSRKLGVKYGVSFSTIQRLLRGDFKPYQKTLFDLKIIEDNSPEDLYWLAGILEAEGSFLKPVPSAPNSPIITIQTTDKDVAHKVAGLFGMSVSEYQPKKTKKSGELPKKVNVISLRGKKAISWMIKLKDLMGQRRQQQIVSAIMAHDPDKEKKAHQARCLLDEGQIVEAEIKIKNGSSLRSVARDLNVRHTVLRDAIIRKNKI